MTRTHTELSLLVIVNKNGPIQDYVHPDGQTQPSYEMAPAGFKYFTNLIYFAIFKKKRNWITVKKHLKHQNWPCHNIIVGR